MGSNLLSGAIPQELGGLTRLQQLCAARLTRATAAGEQRGAAGASGASRTKAKRADGRTFHRNCSTNSLNGTIPPSLGSLASLTVLCAARPARPAV